MRVVTRSFSSLSLSISLHVKNKNEKIDDESKSFFFFYRLIENVANFSFSDEKVKSPKENSREARNAFISDRLLPGVYFAFLTACGVLGGFGFALGRTKKRETTTKLTNQPNATKLFDDGRTLAIKALRRASFYSLTGVFSFSLSLWLISGRPSTFAEFRQWSGSWLPSLKSSKPKEEQGRTEFENLTEFMRFLVDEDQRLKEKKKQQQRSDV